jgi:hypothetical protein
LLPVLCLWDRRTAPFGRYAVEMLHAEGLTGATDWDVATRPATADELIRHQAVIVAPCSPTTGAEKAALAALHAGTAVVFLRPSRSTATALGLSGRSEGIAQDGYLAPARAHPLWFPALGDLLQFHGPADLYERGGSVLAWVADASGPTPHPAIVTGTYGTGRFAVFTYDLATSTVLFHQGRRELASTGQSPDADGDGIYTPNDLFQGYLDVALRHVPQADLQQRLLIRVLEWASEPAGPLVRLWPFPGAKPTVTLINGDSDAMTRAQLEWFVNMTEAHGGNYTIYLLEEHRALVPPTMEADYRRRGHSAGPHIWLSRQPSPDDMARRIQQEVAAFRHYYGHAPTTTRHHCVVWPGWVETAAALAANGIRLETNYRAAAHYQSGYLTGSGLPMRFIDENGEFIDCFQQETLLCDDYVLIDKSFLPPLSVEQAIALSQRLITEACEMYQTVVHLYFHPVYSTGLTVPTGQFIQTATWLEAVLKHCWRDRIPMPSTDAWCAFNQQRRTTILGPSAWDASTGTCSLAIDSATGLPDATLVVPSSFAGRRLERVTLDTCALDLVPWAIGDQSFVLATGPLPAGHSCLEAFFL